MKFDDRQLRNTQLYSKNIFSKTYILDNHVMILLRNMFRNEQRVAKYR